MADKKTPRFNTVRYNPMSENELNALTFKTVGQIGYNGQETLLEHWDGTKWRPIGGITPELEIQDLDAGNTSATWGLRRSNNTVLYVNGNQTGMASATGASSVVCDFGRVKVYTFIGQTNAQEFVFTEEDELATDVGVVRKKDLKYLENKTLDPKTRIRSGSYTLVLGDAVNETFGDVDWGRRYVNTGTQTVTVPELSAAIPVDTVWRFRIDDASHVITVQPQNTNTTIDWPDKTAGQTSVSMTGRKGGLMYIRKVSASAFFVDGDLSEEEANPNRMTSASSTAAPSGDSTMSGTPPTYTSTGSGTGSNFTRVEVTIPIASNNLAVGDTIVLSTGAWSGSGAGRIEVNINGTNNSAIAVLTAPGTITGVIPAGTTNLSVWMYSDYNVSNSGSKTYTNVSLTKQ